MLVPSGVLKGCELLGPCCICTHSLILSQYILPVLYLTLVHHYEILKISAEYVLDVEEFEAPSMTLRHLDSALNTRISSLKGE